MNLKASNKTNLATTGESKTVAPPDMNHLIAFKTPRDGFGCDGCKRGVFAGTTLYGCRACNYDVCGGCFAAAANSPHEWKQVLQCPKQMKANAHLVSYEVPNNNYGCEGCNQPIAKGLFMQGCRTCDYDLCSACYALANASPRNWEQAFCCAILSFDETLVALKDVAVIGLDLSKCKFSESEWKHIEMQLMVREPLKTFKGQKFETKSLKEAIDAVNDLSITTLDLRKSLFGNEGIKKLAAKFQSVFSTSISNIAFLNLSSNRIDDNGAVHIADILKQNACKISHLHLMGNRILQKGIDMICNALKSNKNTLMVEVKGMELHRYLSNEDFLSTCHGNELENVKVETEKINSAVMALKDTRVTTIHLNWEDLEKTGSQELSRSLVKSNVKVLKFYKTNMGDEGLHLLASALATSHSITHLDLTGNNLGDTGAGHLAVALQNPQCFITHLILQDNNFNNAGMKHFSDFLSHPNCKVKYFDIKRNKHSISNEGIEFIYNALASRKSVSPLLDIEGLSLNQTRNLPSKQKGMNNKDILSLFRSLYFNSFSESESKINNNNFGVWTTSSASAQKLSLDESVEALADSAVTSLDLSYKDGPSLAMINGKITEIVRHKQIGDRGAEILSKALRHVEDCSILSLNLSNQRLGSIGVSHIAQAIRHMNSNIVSLDMSENGENMKSLREALEDKNCKVTNLNLAKTPLLCPTMSIKVVTDVSGISRKVSVPISQAIDHLSKAIQHPHCNLLDLNIKNLNSGSKRQHDLKSNWILEPFDNSFKHTNCKITCLTTDNMHIGRLAVIQCSTLLSLDVSDAHLGSGLTPLLTEALRQNSHLTHLNLDNNQLNQNPSHTNDLFEVMKQPECRITNLNIGGFNFIGDVGAKKIADVVQDPNCSITHLGLFCNSITKVGAKVLCKALQKKECHIEYLDMGQNKIGREGLLDFAAALHHQYCEMQELNLKSCLPGGTVDAGVSHAIYNKLAERKTPTPLISINGVELNQCDNLPSKLKEKDNSTILKHLRSLFSSATNTMHGYPVLIPLCWAVRFHSEPATIQEILDCEERKISESIVVAGSVEINRSSHQANTQDDEEHLPLNYACDDPRLAKIANPSKELIQQNLKLCKTLYNATSKEARDGKEQDRDTIVQGAENDMVRQWAEKIGTTYGHFKIEDNDTPIYSSNTCKVYYASDVIKTSAIKKLQKKIRENMIIIKNVEEIKSKIQIAELTKDIMKCKEQIKILEPGVHVCIKVLPDQKNFENELSVRNSIELDPKYVVDLLATYTLEDGVVYVSKEDKDEEDDGRKDATEVSPNELSAENKSVVYNADGTEANVLNQEWAIIMPAGDKSLDRVIADENIAGKNQKEIVNIANSLAESLKHIHSDGKNLIHCDVKPRNFVRFGKHWKLIDLDAAKKMGSRITNSNKFSSGYIPPEMARLLWTHNVKDQVQIRRNVEIDLYGIAVQKVRYDQKYIVREVWPNRSNSKQRNFGDVRLSNLSDPKEEDKWFSRSDVVSISKTSNEFLADITFDTWSFGVVLFQLCSGRKLFSDLGMSDDNLQDYLDQDQLMLWNQRSLNTYLRKLKDDKFDVQDLLHQCLQPDPKQRPTMADILTHKFLTGEESSGDYWQKLDGSMTVPVTRGQTCFIFILGTITLLLTFLHIFQYDLFSNATKYSQRLLLEESSASSMPDQLFINFTTHASFSESVELWESKTLSTIGTVNQWKKDIHNIKDATEQAVENSETYEVLNKLMNETDNKKEFQITGPLIDLGSYLWIIAALFLAYCRKAFTSWPEIKEDINELEERRFNKKEYMESITTTRTESKPPFLERNCSLMYKWIRKCATSHKDWQPNRSYAIKEWPIDFHKWKETWKLNNNGLPDYKKYKVVPTIKNIYVRRQLTTSSTSNFYFYHLLHWWDEFFSAPQYENPGKLVTRPDIKESEKQSIAIAKVQKKIVLIQVNIKMNHEKFTKTKEYQNHQHQLIKQQKDLIIKHKELADLDQKKQPEKLKELEKGITMLEKNIQDIKKIHSIIPNVVRYKTELKKMKKEIIVQKNELVKLNGWRVKDIPILLESEICIGILSKEKLSKEKINAIQTKYYLRHKGWPLDDESTATLENQGVTDAAEIFLLEKNNCCNKHSCYVKTIKGVDWMLDSLRWLFYSILGFFRTHGKVGNNDATEKIFPEWWVKFSTLLPVIGIIFVVHSFFVKSNEFQWLFAQIVVSVWITSMLFFHFQNSTITLYETCKLYVFRLIYTWMSQLYINFPFFALYLFFAAPILLFLALVFSRYDYIANGVYQPLYDVVAPVMTARLALKQNKLGIVGFETEHFLHDNATAIKLAENVLDKSCASIVGKAGEVNTIFQILVTGMVADGSPHIILYMLSYMIAINGIKEIVDWGHEKIGEIGEWARSGMEDNMSFLTIWEEFKKEHLNNAMYLLTDVIVMNWLMFKSEDELSYNTIKILVILGLVVVMATNQFLWNGDYKKEGQFIGCTIGFAPFVFNYITGPSMFKVAVWFVVTFYRNPAKFTDYMSYMLIISELVKVGTSMQKVAIEKMREKEELRNKELRDTKFKELFSIGSKFHRAQTKLSAPFKMHRFKNLSDEEQKSRGFDIKRVAEKEKLKSEVVQEVFTQKTEKNPNLRLRGRANGN